MTATVVVGMQYGDEGKGKVVDFLAKNADYVVRYQGGNNAGHTVVIDNEQTILHLIPSGIFHNKICVLGNGMVLDLDKLKEEIETLESKGISVLENLLISENAHIILPEDVKSSKKDRIGSTGRGIAPAYTNKSAKTGLRVRDILNIEDKIDGIDIRARNRLSIYKKYLKQYEYLKDNVVNVSKVLNDAIEEGKNILFEGAQGTGLDIDHGQYPFVTSSNSTAGGACTGSGIGPTKIDKVIGICKAYITRVDREGESPLTTQLDDKTGKKLRENGHEYGATTGRPRRCGWFDAVLANHAVRVNGISEVILTKLDVLDGFKKLKICTHYELDREKIEDFPTDSIVQRRCKPIYESIKGWSKTVKKAKTFNELPEEARNYIRRIEDLMQTKVSYVTTGHKRDQIIEI